MDKEIQEFMAQAETDDIWEYKGMTLFVIRKTHEGITQEMAEKNPILKSMYEGHWNGYALSTISVPEEEIDELSVHGGVTWVMRGKNETLYGFDVMHLDDFETPKSKGWVMEEAANLADSLLEWAKEHGQ